MTRKGSDWLLTLREYVEETESPRDFWLWGGIFTIAAALERKVWLPFGLDQIYPNLYIMVVAPPGKCRKGAPVSLAKKLLTDIQIPVFVDSPTKRALTKQLAENATKRLFRHNGVIKPMSSIALISKELSSFLAVDLKGMIEVLTDLWDSHDVWEYKTSEKGTDKLHNICVSCLVATTPTWIAANLPEEAIGGGFTSRVVMVSGNDKYKKVAIPPIPNEALKKILVSDLMHISGLSGEFEFSDPAKALFVKWYNSIEQKVKDTSDRRLHGFLERIHVIVLKVAMCLRVSYSDELVVSESDMQKSIVLLTEVFNKMGDALSGHGRSSASLETQQILQHITILQRTTFSELLRLNWHNTSKAELEAILETLIASGLVKDTYDEKRNRILARVRLQTFTEKGEDE